MTRVSVWEAHNQGRGQGRRSKIEPRPPVEADGRVGVHDRRPSAKALEGRTAPPERLVDKKEGKPSNNAEVSDRNGYSI